MSAPVTRAELTDLRSGAVDIDEGRWPRTGARQYAALLLRLLDAYERTDYAPCVACGGAGYRCVARGGSGVTR